jgi:hypothetical protein
MSHRLNPRDAGKVGAAGCRSRLCVCALAILVAACISVPRAARADAIVSTSGELIEGVIVGATRNTVVVRRAIGGMRQMRIQDIAEVRIVVQGRAIAGELLGWADGVLRVRSGGEILRISGDRVLTRERRDQASPPSPRGPPPALGQLLRPVAPRPPEGPTVEAAAPAATVVRRTRIAAASATVERAVAVTPAVVAIAEITPAVAAPEPVAAEVDRAKIVVPRSPVEAPATEVSSVESPPAEVAVAEFAVPSGAAGGDQPLAVKGSVHPAEAGVERIVFRIELSRPAAQTVVLIYGTVDGTAKAGEDYEPQQGVVTLAAGSKSADVRVPLIEHRRPRDVRFGLFLTADPKVAKVVDPWISATIPAAD